MDPRSGLGAFLAKIELHIASYEMFIASYEMFGLDAQSVPSALPIDATPLASFTDKNGCN
jgi:hypothetical protein